MTKLLKSNPPIPKFANLELVPVSNVINVFFPYLQLVNPENVYSFEWAIDSIDFDQKAQGTQKSQIFNTQFSAFIAGISDYNTRMLQKISKEYLIAILTDHNNNKYIIGDKDLPLRILFNPDFDRVGYHVSASHSGINPLRQVTVYYGTDTPENPVVPPPPDLLVTVTLGSQPQVPSHYLQGAGTYTNGDVVRLDAASPEIVQGLGWMEFVHWMKFIGPGNYDIVSTANPYTFTISEHQDIHLLAYYQPMP